MLEVFTYLLPRIAPLFLLIFIGFISGKYLEMRKEGISKLSIYILVPIIMFMGVMKASLSITVIMLPLMVWGISTLACLTVLKLGRVVLEEKTQANILALAAGTANSGYFGIPIAFMLFEDHIVGLYITTVLGMTLFQNSVGFYVTARGNYTPKESFIKLLKLPVIYAFILGVVLSYAEMEIPEFLQEFFRNIQGAYVVVGMMIIGVGIAQIKEFGFNWKFTGLAFFARFVVWPTLAFAVYQLDKHSFGVLGEDAARVMILAGIVPLAADTVALATILKCHPEEMASTVLMSTFFALIYLPIMVSLFL